MFPPIFFALIFSLRLFGLFSLIPLLRALLEGTNNFNPLSLAYFSAAYSFFQALMQFPLAKLSDYYGRLTIIRCGFYCFIIGSFTCFFSTTFTIMLLGRALQGAGAVGATVQAMMADYAQGEEKLQSYYYLVGVGILLSLMASFLMAPFYTNNIGVKSVFLVNAALGLLPIYFSFKLKELATFQKKDAQVSTSVQARQRIMVNLLTFTLHTLQMFAFTVNQFVDQESYFYLRALGIALLVTCYPLARRQLKLSFKFSLFLSVVGLLVSLLALMVPLYLGVIKFFWMANMLSLMLLLEASLPTYLSQLCRIGRGGSMGIYSTAQYLGMSLGPFVLLLAPTLQMLWFECFEIAAKLQSPPKFYIYSLFQNVSKAVTSLFMVKKEDTALYLSWAPFLYCFLYLLMILFIFTILFKIDKMDSSMNKAKN